MGTWIEDLREDLTPIGPSYWGYPHPISMNLDRGSDGGTATHQPETSLSPQSSHTRIGLLLPSVNPRLSTTFTKDAKLYEC